MKPLRAERKHDAILEGGRTCNVMAAVAVGAMAAGSAYSANKQSKAAGQAAAASERATELSVEENRRQFDAMQKLMTPYVDAGAGALGGQQTLLGLNGADAQGQAIAGLQASPQYMATMQAGSDAIMANASATGGLRGGNAQAALGQFGMQNLSNIIQQQYQNLGGLTSMGQNAAAGVGNAGMQTGTNISNLLMQNAATQGNAYLAQGKAQAQVGNTLAGFGSMYLGGKF